MKFSKDLVHTFLQCSISAAGLLILSSCGAMNPKPSAAGGASAANARCTASAVTDPGDGSTLSVTDGAHFVIKAHFSDLQGEATKTSPMSGNLSIRGFHGVSLLSLTKDTQITVTYARERETEKPTGHDPYQIAMTYQPDANGGGGAFTGAFSNITRSGMYDFVITLSDQGENDVHTVAFALKK